MSNSELQPEVLPPTTRLRSWLVLLFERALKWAGENAGSKYSVVEPIRQKAFVPSSARKPARSKHGWSKHKRSRR